MEEVQQSSSQMMMIMKGKRTKRQRPMSPFNTTTTPTALTYSSSSNACADDYGNSFTSASYESTEEDEDMANCLILLAQGGAEKSASALPKDQTSPVHQVNRVSGHVSKSGFFVYECKKCNRTFPSFQALGGHRASHKKPKTSDQHDKKPKTSDQHDKKPALETTHLNDSMTNNSTSSTDNKEVEDSKQHVCVKNTSPPPPPTQAKSTSISTKGFQISNKVKIHECSICGSEFSSGQALGGHMRRHRAIVDKSNITTTTTTSQMLLTSVVDNMKPQQRQKERSNILALDLNLPAPEDHDHHQHDSKFQFMPTQQTRLVFNAPALVDCHY